MFDWVGNECLVQNLSLLSFTRKMNVGMMSRSEIIIATPTYHYGNLFTQAPRKNIFSPKVLTKNQ